MFPISGKARGPSEKEEFTEVDWGDFYDVVVGSWGIAPSEFWDMCPDEIWRLHELKRPRDPETDYAGSLRDSDVQHLYGLLNV